MAWHIPPRSLGTASNKLSFQWQLSPDLLPCHTQIIIKHINTYLHSEKSAICVIRRWELEDSQADILGPQTEFWRQGMTKLTWASWSLAETWDCPLTDSARGQQDQRMAQVPLSSWEQQMRLSVSLGKPSHQLPIWSTTNIKGQTQAVGSAWHDLLGADPLLRDRSQHRQLTGLVFAAAVRPQGSQMGACSWLSAHGPPCESGHFRVL